MRGLDRSAGLPFLAFALAFGIAIWISVAAGSAPEARIHARARAYLAALRLGDPEAAAPYRYDADPRQEVRRADALEGVTYLLEGVEVSESRTEARVTVIWLQDERRGIRERQIWTREPEGTWHFRAVDGVPERIGG